MDDVDPGGVADMAGIRKGDFLLEINGHDVRQASHETVVGLIRKSGDLVKLIVVTVAFEPMLMPATTSTPPPSTTSTNTANNNNRQYSTLPRKLHGNNSNRASIQPPPPPKRGPSTTLIVGRARARSMVANLAALEALDKAIHEHDSSTSESVSGSVDSVQRMPDLLVETNNKGQQQLQQGQQGQFLAFSEEQNNNKMNSMIQSKVYASVAEMKRMKLQASKKSNSAEDSPTSKQQTSQADLQSQVIINGGGLRKGGFSSTPDLKSFATNVPLIPLEELKVKIGVKTSAKTDLDLTLHHYMQDDGNVGDQRGYFTLP